LEDWKLSDKVCGKNQRASTLLENLLGDDHNLFYLACRHHIHELIVAAAYGSSSAKDSKKNGLS
jgi:hypothetical protein